MTLALCGTCLDKPFAEVCKASGIEKRITPRSMRRTAEVTGRDPEEIFGHRAAG